MPISRPCGPWRINKKTRGILNKTKTVLIGNSFPASLIRRDVNVHCVSVDDVRVRLQGAQIHSFWGHSETLPAVDALLGVSLKPRVPRPVLLLSPDGLPMLDGQAFSSCYVCSPDCRPGFRHQEGQVLSQSDIVGWQLLRFDWI